LVDGVGKFWAKAFGTANTKEDKASSRPTTAIAPRRRDRANKIDLEEIKLDIRLNTEISTTSPRTCPTPKLLFNEYIAEFPWEKKQNQARRLRLPLCCPFWWV
jgi:hypothetical protein